MIQEKVDKDFVPVKDEEGFVKTVSDRMSLCRVVRDDFDANGYIPGRWYFLFRNNCFIDDVASMLEQYIVPYHTAKGFCVASRDIAKVRRYFNYRKVGFGSDGSKKSFMELNRIEDIEDDFTESSLIPGENRYAVKSYIDTYGVDKLSEMALGAPYLLASTPHRVKGGEADYVAVFLDCTSIVADNALLQLDEELRVLYVACTRARKGLYLVPSVGKYGLDNIVELVQEAIE
jgi:hypothetical protein